MNEAHTVERLLVAVAKKDRDALRALYDASAPQLYALAHRLCRSPQGAEDVMHDSFQAAWRRAGAFDPTTTRGMTWLSAIIRNRAIDRLHRQRAEKTKSGVYEGRSAQLPDVGTARLHIAELDRALSGFDALEPSEQEALLLAYYQGWSRSDLAAHFDVTPKVMKARLTRALTKLRRASDHPKAGKSKDIRGAETALGLVGIGPETKGETALRLRWEQRFAPLAFALPPQHPPQDLWYRISGSLDRAVDRAALRVKSRSVSRWRWATLFASAVAVGLAGYIVTKDGFPHLNSEVQDSVSDDEVRDAAEDDEIGDAEVDDEARDAAGDSGDVQ